jgi:hypothetical protein
VAIFGKVRTMMKILATAEVHGSYGKELVWVYAQNGVVRFLAPSWRPMKFADACMACRKLSSHPRFVRFLESEGAL